MLIRTVCSATPYSRDSAAGLVWRTISSSPNSGHQSCREPSKTQFGLTLILPSLQVLASIGFGCRQEENVLRVGPVQKGEGITEEDVQRMDRYMLRTWVEVNLALLMFMARQGGSGGRDNKMGLTGLQKSSPLNRPSLSAIAH